ALLAGRSPIFVLHTSPFTQRSAIIVPSLCESRRPYHEPFIPTALRQIVCLLDNRLLIERVPGRRTLSRTRAPRPPDIMQGPAPINELREPEAHVSPRAHVSRLLLQPRYLFQIGIALEHRAQVLFGKGIELLDATQRDGAACAATLARDQVDVHLAARQDQAPHLARELP